MRKLLGNLPVILGAALVIAFSADLPALRPLKTETSYGLWVVVLVPAAIALLLVQVVLWVRLPGTRLFRRGGSSDAG